MASWITIITSYFALFGTALVLLYVYLDRKFRYWELLGAKTTSFNEFLFNLSKYGRMPMHESQVETYKKHGRLFGQYGPLCSLLVAEPYLIKQVLVKDFHAFRNRMKTKIGDEYFQKMVSMLCDEDWKRIRCIMSPTFSSSKMRKMAVLVKDCSDNAAKYLDRIAEKGEEIDIKQYFGAFAVDVIAATAFATKINSLDNPQNEFMINARKIGNRNVSILSVLLVMVAPRLAKLFKLEIIPSDAINYYKDIVLKILEERKNTKMKGHDFLQLMMDAKDGFIEITAEENERRGGSHIEILPKHKTMTLEEVISQCILFFIGGHDATSSTLSFAAYRLAMNPDCQEKLIHEIEEAWEKHGKMDFDIVSEMPYLDAVLCETLRVDSNNLMLIREANEDYKLADTGITIPKGASVVIPIYAMHHDPEWFPNPEKFDPDRFLPENKHLITPFSYLPFGEGPRNCIAMRFITMVMKLCLAYTLRDMKFVATEETRKPLEYFQGQGLLQAKRVPLKVEKRN